MIIERLARSHARAEFDCGEDDLNRFLRQIARQDADRGLGVTYVAVPGEGDPEVLGYYTVTMGEIAPAVIPAAGLPPHRAVPVALLGRLAVSVRHQRRGIGEMLLFDAFYRVLKVSAELGVYAVVVDALHERACRFYVRYGFLSLADDPLHLYLTLSGLRKLGLAPGA